MKDEKKQRMNLCRNNGFRNWTQLPWLCDHTPSATGSYGRLTGVRQNTGRFEIFKNFLQITLLGFSWSLKKLQCYYSITYALPSVFFR